MVTPILSVNEWKQEAKDMYDRVDINSKVGPVVDAVGGIAVELLAEKAARNKFAFCEEGIVLYPSGGPILHRWSRIRSFSAHPKENRFDFKVSGYISAFSFHT